MTKYIFFAFAVSMLVSSVAHAQPATDQVTINVRYDDLDLSKSAGVAALHQRIHAAARNICGDRPSIPSIDGTWGFPTTESRPPAYFAS